MGLSTSKARTHSRAEFSTVTEACAITIANREWAPVADTTVAAALRLPLAPPPSQPLHLRARASCSTSRSLAPPNACAAADQTCPRSAGCCWHVEPRTAPALGRVGRRPMCLVTLLPGHDSTPLPCEVTMLGP